MTSERYYDRLNVWILLIFNAWKDADTIYSKPHLSLGSFQSIYFFQYSYFSDHCIIYERIISKLFEFRWDEYTFIFSIRNDFRVWLLSVSR